MQATKEIARCRDWVVENFEDLLSYSGLGIALVLAVAAKSKGGLDTSEELLAWAQLLALTTLVILALRLLARLRGIKLRLENPLSDHWEDHVIQQIPRYLRAAYANEVRAFCRRVRDAIHDHRVEITTQPLASRFQSGYVAALEELEGCELFATSLADPAYFWGPHQSAKDVRATKPVLDAIASFVRRGKMHRLFILGAPEPNAQERAVLDQQHALGVQVTTIQSDLVHESSRRYFVIDARGERFAWEAKVSGQSAEIIEVRATENPEDLRELHQVRRELFDSGNCRPWPRTPDASPSRRP